MSASYETKLGRLAARLAGLESLAVAFSGGVDSAVLLHAATRALGERAAGVIADSPSLPRRELLEARELARSFGARLVVLETAELEHPLYRANRGDRCYFCKAELFAAAERWARAEGFAALAYGEIADDLADERPGRRAAGEFGVLAPLCEAGLTKAEVRRYAREFGLAVSEKPASACLASRIPVGTEVTRERLAVVEAAEEALRSLGLSVLRVRHQGELARVEVGAAELGRAQELRPRIAEALAAAGFSGFRLELYLPPGQR